jgi:hypothetical protein
MLTARRVYDLRERRQGGLDLRFRRPSLPMLIIATQRPAD